MVLSSILYSNITKIKETKKKKKNKNKKGEF